MDQLEDRLNRIADLIENTTLRVDEHSDGYILPYESKEEVLNKLDEAQNAIYDIGQELNLKV